MYTEYCERHFLVRYAHQRVQNSSDHYLRRNLAEMNQQLNIQLLHEFMRSIQQYEPSCYSLEGVRRHVKPRHQWLCQLKLDNSSRYYAVAVLTLVPVKPRQRPLCALLELRPVELVELRPWYCPARQN
jgi:hypothetical protein